MLVAIDAVGIRGHGGASVLTELSHWLPIVRPAWKWHLFLFDCDLREFNDPPVGGNVSLEHIKDGNSGLARLVWVNHRLQKRLKEINPDVLFSFANVGPANPSVPQVVFVQQLLAFSYESISHVPILTRVRSALHRQQILRGAKASRAVIVQTEAMRGKMVEFVPELDGKIQVIPSGYRTPSLSETIRKEIRDRIDSITRPRLIYISVPRLYKNHITLIRAFGNILRIFPSASLLLTVGRDDHRDRDMALVRKYLKQEIQKLRISDRVAWFEWLTPDEVNYAHSTSDLMLFPSLAESFGLPLVEAMAVGCPVAAADLPYAHEVLGDAAIYFNPRSAEDLGEHVISVLKSPETLRNIMKLGKQRSVSFSYEKIANQIANILEKVAHTEIH